MTIKEFITGVLMATVAMWGAPMVLIITGHGWWSIPVILFSMSLFVMGLWKVFDPVPLFDEIPQERESDR